MIRLGVPINTVSKMLGHSSVTITLDIYAHVLDEMQEEAVGKMDATIAKYLSDMEDSAVESIDTIVEETPETYTINYRIAS